ncbi:MAG TPA: DUF4258 domain-containing protein [Chloroflexota bacterium]|nr:DUF4258 domain-containing protein [Chloroflexota bacterium]
MAHDDRNGPSQAAVARIRARIATGALRVTQHAQQEMFADAITLDAVIEAIGTGQLLEDYPDHRRGACCLICGRSGSGRFIHVVCTTEQPVVIIITVYEPIPPKWVTPTQRRPA